MSRARRALRRVASAVVALTALAAAFMYPPSASVAAGCDTAPTGVQVSDHWLHFKMPPGLMPDPRFDGRPAKLEVHRVQPVYAHGKCSSVSNRAAVLIHGKNVYGPPVFDLRQPTPEGGELSVQKALARAGIDTFAPNLLGFGRSTGFGVLNDPGNASLPAFNDNGTCAYPGCDRTHIPLAWPLDQQGDPNLLFINPLDRQRRPHSNNIRFARTDVFVRDIRQVIDDAISRAQPSDGKVTLLGYSAGAFFVGRTLYTDRLLPATDRYIAKLNRVVFLSSFLTPTTEEALPPTATSFATFPLQVFDAAFVASTWQMPADREPACTGHVVPGSREQLWAQVLEDETVGLEWGGSIAGHPTGLARSPVFSSYGWNTDVAKLLSLPPTLVVHGLDDIPPTAVMNARAIYGALSMTTNKVLVEVGCASHALLFEGCSGQRCTPPANTAPYGGTAGTPWAGPHSTLKAALIEWIKNATFDDASNGRFTVNESGVASKVP